MQAGSVDVLPGLERRASRPVMEIKENHAWVLFSVMEGTHGFVMARRERASVVAKTGRESCAASCWLLYNMERNSWLSVLALLLAKCWKASCPWTAGLRHLVLEAHIAFSLGKIGDASRVFLHIHEISHLPGLERKPWIDRIFPKFWEYGYSK
jgi:hypothetical protein